MKFDFKKILPHAIAMVVFVLLSAAYFAPQLSGKILPQGDIVSYKSTSKEVQDYRKETGDQALWTTRLFGGMPTYQIAMRTDSNLLTYVRRIASLGFKGPIGMFIFGMIGCYILFLTLRVNPYLSIVGAALYVFGTNFLVMLEAGHNTKIWTLFTCAPIIAGVIQAYRGELFRGGVLFALAMGINLLCNHPQMTYYLGMALIPLVIAYFVKAIKQGELATFAKASGVLLVGALLALGASATRIMTTLEYAEDSMRGKSILAAKTTAPKSSSETEGLEWNYAMNWSNGAEDLLVSWIPKAVGGGSVDFVSKDSPFGKAVRARQPVQTYTYFGGLPSTAGPVYFGAVIFFLWFLSLFVGKGVIRWWSLAAVILTFMISMGSYLEWFNRLLFDYAPMFNKFRSHSSITGITNIIVVLGGIYGLSQIIKAENKEKLVKPFLIGTGVLAVITLLVAMIGPSMMDLSTHRDGQFAQQPQLLEALLDTRASLMKMSALRSLAFILATAAVIYFFLREKLGQGILIGAVAVLGILDLVPIDREYVSAENFVKERKYKAAFAPTAADSKILKDTDPHYRVYDTQRFFDAAPSYHHKQIGGYHPAKLQRYEDLKNRYIVDPAGRATNDMNVINMLNTKYLIIYNEDQPTAQRNPAALGNAWFVSKVRPVATANEEIDALGQNFDPALEAVVHNEYADYVAGLAAGNKNGKITLSKYSPDKITYTSQADTEQLAVFSEIWYGPDKGWKASIDGQPVDHIRANYVLRALRVPAGQHEIVFEFAPSSYTTGNLISLLCSALILLGSLLWVFRSRVPFLKDF